MKIALLKRWSILLIAVMVVVGGCSSAPKPYTINIDASIARGLGYFEERALRKNLEWAVDSVSAFLNKPFAETLQVVIFEHGWAYGGDRTVHLGKKRIKNREAIIYGVTEAIAELQVYTFKSKGLAGLMVMQYYERNGGGSYVLKFLRDNADKLLPIDSLMNNSSIFINDNDSNTKVNWLEPAAFYAYLLHRDGLTKFQEFYGNDLDGIEVRYGASVDSLDAEWRNWLLGNSATDTVSFR